MENKNKEKERDIYPVARPDLEQLPQDVQQAFFGGMQMQRLELR